MILAFDTNNQQITVITIKFRDYKNIITITQYEKINRVVTAEFSTKK